MEMYRGGDGNGDCRGKKRKQEKDIQYQAKMLISRQRLH